MNLLIVGAGGSGRCCLDIALEMNCFNNIAFIDDILVGNMVNEKRVIGKINDMEKLICNYDCIAVSIGDCVFRKKTILKAKQIGYKLPLLISKSSYISPKSTILEGTIVFPNVTIEANSIIGVGCIITSNCVINHDSSLSDFILVNTLSVVRPLCQIDELVNIGVNCVIRKGKCLSRGQIIDDCSIV